MIGLASRLGTVRAPTNGAADVWFARVGEHAPAVDRLSAEFLPAQEREKVGTYRSRDTAERYVVTRSLVRCVLSEELGVAPVARHELVDLLVGRAPLEASLDGQP